jgi:phage-related protein
MIFFNGTALESVAPVKIDDIRVSPIQLSPVSRERAIRFGSEFVRMQGGNRNVSIMFALLTNDIDLRQSQIKEITKWARSEKPERLVLPYHDGVYLECACVSLPEPSTRQWWENPLTITFSTFGNPYWTSIEEKSCACGTAFYVGGDAPPIMQIRNTFSSAASNQSYSDSTNTMTFSSISAGDMVIDLNNQTAAVGTASIMPYYSFSSTFIQPKTGTQTITGTGTVYWRERWE